MAIEDPEQKAMVKALLREYPLDQMQAETLVWAFFSGLIPNDDIENQVHPRQLSESQQRGQIKDTGAEQRVQRTTNGADEVDSC